MADDAREYEKVAQTAFRSGAKPPKHPVGKSTVKRMITNAGWAGVIFIGLFAWTAFGLAIAAYVKEQAISVPSLSNVVNITIAGQSVKFCYPNSTNIQTVINNVNLNIIQGGDIYLCPGVFTGPLLIKQPGINLYGAAEGGTVLWEASVTIDLSVSFSCIMYLKLARILPTPMDQSTIPYQTWRFSTKVLHLQHLVS